MDRWNIVTTLNYLELEKEMEIVLSKNKNMNNIKGKEIISNMIKVAALTRKVLLLGIYLLSWPKDCYSLG